MLDFSKDICVVYTEFNVGEFAEGMREKYPSWTNRAIYNPRYWQPRARKFHKLEEEKALGNIEYIERCPEARGVNVTELMKLVGIDLKWDWPPQHSLDNVTYIVSLGGFRNS